MNEPKRRGRPPKVTPGTVPVINGHGAVVPGADALVTTFAQAYANRVWSGQSITADRPWRIARVMEALEGQNLPTEGVVLP
jgi:hypothetical protein